MIPANVLAQAPNITDSPIVLSSLQQNWKQIINYNGIHSTGQHRKLVIDCNAPVNVKPQGGGRPSGFWHFLEAKVKFPTPGHLVNVKFAIYLLKFLTQQTILDVKIPALGEFHDVKFPWVAHPHPGA